MSKLNIENLQRMVSEKYISVQKHPEFDYYIYNYTPRAQYERVWNNETLQARGLILDKDYNVISRPFKKFFNWGEAPVSQTRHLQSLINSGEAEFSVTEKMDGSLGITYFGPDGKMYFATRGSFISEQAKKAQEIWDRKYSHIKLYSVMTWLFEIIYPQNRIVVNYGETEDLVLLAAIDSGCGCEMPYSFTKAWAETGLSVVKSYDGITDFSKIEQRPNSEGYVIHFYDEGIRLKVKFDEYVRLHKILTGINAKRIWEILKAGQTLDEILDRVPDEFYAWVKKTADNLTTAYQDIEVAAKDLHWACTNYYPTRKDQALFLREKENSEYAPIVFRMLDGKDYSNIIWDLLEPPFEKPFMMDEA